MPPNATGPAGLSFRAKQWLTAAVAVGPAVMLFAGAELYVRSHGRSHDLLALTGRALAEKPIAEWSYLDAFSAFRGRPGVYRNGPARKTVNRHGFISTPDLEVTKPPHTIRIVFLGESSTAGTGFFLPDEATWPWLVADELRRQPGRRSHIEFINGALGAYTSFESLGRLWSRLRFFSPDIVVVYHGWNEMYYFNQVDAITGWRTLPDGSWGLSSTVPVAVYSPRWYDWLIWPSQLLTRVRLRFSTPLAGEAGGVLPPATLPDTFDSRGPEIFRSNLRLMRAVARAIGAELLVAKQATLIVPDLPVSERQRARVEKHGFSYEAHLEAFRRLYRVIDEETDPRHRIDVTSLSGIPENFHDHIHPTELGARRIASVVSRALEPFVAQVERRQSVSPP